jgi:hypothetical protein
LVGPLQAVGLSAGHDVVAVQDGVVDYSSSAALPALVGLADLHSLAVSNLAVLPGDVLYAAAAHQQQINRCQRPALVVCKPLAQF